VPSPHLVLEEPRQQQALCTRRFHHQAVLPQRRIRHKMIEDRAEIGRRSQVGASAGRGLGVVREHARVVQQLLSIDARIADVPKTDEKELQNVPLIGREQLPQRTHDASRVAVPLATYTGWNFRDPSIGAPEQRTAFMGSYFPLPLTREQREAVHDPRLSISDRYASEDDYLARYRAAAEELVKERWILPEDLAGVLKRGKQEWKVAHELGVGVASATDKP